MKNEIRIEAEHSLMHQKVRLFGMVKSDSLSSSVDSRRVFKPLEATALEKGDEGMPFEPFLELDLQEARHLLESLWRAGVRSPEITSTLGEINATQNHLKDMQRLVFDKKGE